MGQSVFYGKVISEESGLPVNRVSVLNELKKTGVQTNDSGAFGIPVTEGDWLVFSKTGYETRRVQVRYEQSGKFVLVFKGLDHALDEVVISAGKSDQSLKNTSVSMEVIKPYIIQNKNPNTAEYILDQVPGIQTINGQVVIRSGSGWSYGAGSRVMVMVDGMPLASGDAGQVQWSFIPIENIERMEVIKGASSVLFGSSALNGVINIRTARPGIKPLTRVTAFYGIYDKPAEEGLEWNGGKTLYTTGIRAFHARRFGKNAITLTFNGFKDAGYRMSDEDNRFRIGWQYQRDLKKLKGFAAVNGNFQTGRSSSFLLWESDRLAYTAMDSSFTENQTSRFHVDPVLLFYTGKWKQLIQGRYLQVSNQVLQVNTQLSQSNYSDFFYGEYQLSRTFSRGISFVGGITGNYANSNSPLYPGKQKAVNSALFLQTTYQSGPWNLDLGGRYEYYKLNSYREGKPVFRAGFSRALSKFTFLRASFGQGYRFPTIAESYISTFVGPLKIYPNPGLKSETGWNAEIGIKQGLKIKGINAIADLAVFQMRYNRMMEFTFGQWERNSATLGLGFKSLNVSEASIKGIDLSLAGQSERKGGVVKWLAGYTYAKAIALHPGEVFYTDSLMNPLSFITTSSDPEGNRLKYRPEHLIRLDLEYTYKQWEAGVSGRYNSYLHNIDKAFVSFPINLAVPGIQDMRDRGKSGDYVVDLRFGKSFKGLKALILINNLFNRVYMTRPCDMRPPRSFMVQLSRNF